MQINPRRPPIAQRRRLKASILSLSRMTCPAWPSAWQGTPTASSIPCSRREKAPQPRSPPETAPLNSASPVADASPATPPAIWARWAPATPRSLPACPTLTHFRSPSRIFTQMARRDSIVAWSLFFSLAACAPTLGQIPSPMSLVANVPLPGPPVRFDYQSFDRTRGRLYIAHMNADQLVVFDVKKREVVANLDGFANVHGVLAVPEINRVF